MSSSPFTWFPVLVYKWKTVCLGRPARCKFLQICRQCRSNPGHNSFTNRAATGGARDGHQPPFSHALPRAGKCTTSLFSAYTIPSQRTGLSLGADTSYKQYLRLYTPWIWLKRSFVTKLCFVSFALSFLFIPRVFFMYASQQSSLSSLLIT